MKPLMDAYFNELLVNGASFGGGTYFEEVP
jgi:hypothetical protein